MLQSLNIENFKGFSSARIELKPVTILFGPNGSGKSTILQAAAVLSQSASTKQDGRTGFILDGPLVSFNQRDWAFHKKNTSLSITLGCSCSIEDPATIEALGGIQPGNRTRKTRKKEATASYHYTCSEFTRHYCQELALNGDVVFLSEEGPLRKTSGEPSSDRNVMFPKLPGKMRTMPYSYSYFLDDRSFHNLFYGMENIRKNEEAKRAILAYRDLLKYIKYFLYEKVFYLSAMRYPAVQTAAIGDDRTSSVGVHGEKTLNVLANIFGPSGNPVARQSVISWARRFGLPDFIAGAVSTNIGPVSIEASYQDPEMKVTLNLGLAGFGSIQMIPVIAQLFSAPEESIVMIEEPETSLHPAGQILLPNLFADAAARKVQVMISTHSQLLVSAVRHAVKTGKIKWDQVAIYDMEKTQRGCMARRLDMDKRGAIPGWIPSFAKVEDEMFEKWGSK